MPDELTRFIWQHNLVRADVQAIEQPEPLQQAVAQVAGLVLRSFAELAGPASTRDALWSAARAAAAAGPTDAATSAAGSSLLRKVLDDRYYGTINATALKVGVSTATVSYLLGLVPAVALAVMGSIGAEQQWTAQQLADWLRPRYPVPAAPAPPTPPTQTPAAPVAARATPQPAPAAVAGTSSWFAKPTHLLLVFMTIVAAAEFGYILSLRAGASAATEAPASASATSPAGGQYVAGPVASAAAARPAVLIPAMLKLNSGGRQLINATSMESKLYRFLIDPSQQVNLGDPAKNWIWFDRIHFETGKAMLTEESLWQLANVASILKRFPTAKVKIGDYTDNAGRPNTDPLLSQQRAEAARNALVSLGVPADHLVAVGYEALNTIAGTNTPEGRIFKHRLSLQVMQK
jgi:outer membrane protein OmpA-like peptidoglycan-associated protein